MLLGSTSLARAYLGATAISRAYLGAVQVWSASTNPTLSTVAFTSPGSGAPQRLDITASYAGADTLRLILATRNGGTALTAAQLLAGTGTFLERVVVNPFSGTEVALSSLTATSEAATAVDVILAEVNNGGVSAVVTETVSGLDFTPESRVSVATNTAGDEVVVTWSGTLFDPAAAPDIAAGDFTMTGHTLTSPVLSGATVTLSVSPSVAFGDSDTLDYTGTALKDVNGNTIATFSGVEVTNSVPSVSSDVAFLAERNLFSTDSTGMTTASSSAVAPTAGSNRSAFLVVTALIESTTPVISAEWGTSNAFDLVSAVIPAVGTSRMILAVFVMREADLPSGSEVITVNSTAGIGRINAQLVEYENTHQSTAPGVLTAADSGTFGSAEVVGVMTSVDALFFSVTAWGSSSATPVTITAGTGSTTPVKRVDRAGIFANAVAVADELPGATGSVSHVHTASTSTVRSRMGLEIFPAA